MSSSPRTVRLISVFVSSPGDVAKERAVLDEVVQSINSTDGEAGKFRLELFRWGVDVTPRIGPKPQQVVDEETPAYDIYLGIMSTRFGTPTGRYGSGTEKEFRDALKNWKGAGYPWITFYFDAQPQLTGDAEQAKQFVKVCEFKAKLQKQGIVATYAGVRGSADSFYEKVSEHLRKVVRLLPHNLEGEGETDAAEDTASPPHTAREPVIPDAYLRWLQDDCADVDLLGLRVQHGQAVKINNVYVPLTTQTAEPKRGDRVEVLDEIREERPVQTLLGLLDGDSLYVAGPPGSGKSTFCRWVAWLACEGTMPPAKIPPPSNYREPFPASFAGRLPLLVRLRDFWSSLPQKADCPDLTELELREALAAWVEGKHPGGLTWSHVESHLEHGSLLLILDGVDEVPLSRGDAKNRCQPRAMLLAGMSAAMKSWTDRGNRVLLTSRPYGLGKQDLRKLGLPFASVGDLDQPIQELLVRRWFACLIERPETAESTARQMLQHITVRQDIQQLATNPMLLTAICIIYHQGQRLPQGRYDLYDRIVDNVLFNRFPKDREVIDTVRNRLAVVAYGMHTGHGLGEQRSTPQAEVTFAEIDHMIQTYQDRTSWTEPGYTSAVEAREQLLMRTGLLLPREENRAAFYHFTFQDFFAAQRMLDVREDELFDVFRDFGGTPEWRSTLSFVFGAQLARHSSPQRSSELLGGLVGSLTDDDIVLAVLVGECMQILLKRGVQLKEALNEKFRQFCVSSIGREVPLRERHELALTLGHLGDPRIVIDLRDPAAYVAVPAGTYRLGGDREAWSPLDEEIFVIEQPLLLSRFPVTNGQYAKFIDDGGYLDQQWWSGDGWKWREQEKIRETRFWHDAKWNAPNKPVVGVCYWEAEAFAKWAGGRLPSEREWEAAARGADSHVYPWGNEWEDGICNSGAAQLGETSAVGIFPRSRAADSGLEDMAGNVWEWCSDEEAAIRVIRGGSWAHDARLCRSARRIWIVPEYRVNFLGFRVAAVPPSEQAGNKNQ